MQDDNYREIKYTTYEVTSTRKRKPVTIKHPSDVRILLKNYANKRQEHFIVLTMSGCSNVISVRVATVGLANKTIVHPREVFIHAIKDNASSIIIAQNHPSDNASPSDEDREVTRMLQNAGGILGIKVLDHAIVVKSGYYSLKQNNEM